MDDNCSDCNKRATSKLVEYNTSFEGWVKEMENKYGVEHANSRPTVGDDFSAALEERKQLRQRCHAVGSKLSMKQKQFERYHYHCNRFESELDIRDA